MVDLITMITKSVKVSMKQAVAQTTIQGVEIMYLD